MVKKRVFILIALVLLVSGCTGNNELLNPQGLSFNFVSGNPPGELENEEGFQIVMQVINPLEQEIDFQACITGGTPSEYGGVDQRYCKFESIPGGISTQGKVTPETKEIYFPDIGSEYYYTNLENGPSKTTLIGEIIYDINGNSAFDICIPSAKSTTCNSEQTISGNEIRQGSYPIIIQKVDKKITSRVGEQGNIDLDIYLSKSSNGEILGENGLSLIDLRVSLGSTGQEFICSPLREDMVVYREGDVVNCESLVSRQDSDYTESVNIIMRYTYKVQDRANIIFQKENVIA